VPTDEEVAARVGERVVVLLEDRLRACTALERERFARFVPVVRDLVAEGEPELLAMLLDQVYRTGAAPAVPVESEPFVEAPLESEAAEVEEAHAPRRRKKRPARSEASEPAGDGAPPDAD
jgi:ATP-dependent RNA helicase DeaD